MIQASAWFCEAHCGVWTPDGKGARRQPAPALTATEEVAVLAGRPIKYFARMTLEAQMCACAAGLALQGARWMEDGEREREIGVLAAGFEGCLAADAAYFADYVASGRKLGRASLFVYTLPTSAACAVSMALALTGPVLHVYEDARCLLFLVRQAAAMAADGEAGGMLALWSDPRAAVCVAVGAGEEIRYPAFLEHQDISPWQLAQNLHAMMPSL